MFVIFRRLFINESLKYNFEGGVVIIAARKGQVIMNKHCESKFKSSVHGVNMYGVTESFRLISEQTTLESIRILFIYRPNLT